MNSSISVPLSVSLQLCEDLFSRINDTTNDNMSYSVEVGLPTACRLERGFSDLKPVFPLACAPILPSLHACRKSARPVLDTGRGSVISTALMSS